MEIKKSDEIEPKLPKVDEVIVGKQKRDNCVKLEAEAAIAKKVPWHRQEGIKRGFGGALMLCGGILSMFPTTNLLGQGVFCAGSALFGYGVVKAAEKSGPETNNNIGLFQTIIDNGKKIFDTIKKK